MSPIHQTIVTSEQMAAIESRVFAAGMPVAALMEKVAGLVARRIQVLYPVAQFRRVGVIVGPGHNGGDALVVARELGFQGYQVQIYQPLERLKELTQCHANYVASLGIPWVEQVETLADCDVVVDGLFGFGLTRPLEGAIATAVEQINQFSCPVVSIDLPSGLHTDTGEVLGTAICATHTLCLGLWKRAFFQDDALESIGTAELVDFNLPLADIQAVMGESPDLQRMTAEGAIAALPLPRKASTHKYKQGHLLLVCGSRPYNGAAILTALAARASGVGMLSVAVPEAIKPLVVSQVPDALVVGCPETESGAIAQFPDEVDLSKFDAIACGPGLTTDATDIVKQTLESDRPLVLDADGLNLLAKLGVAVLKSRQSPTILTPHSGEFKRLFPELVEATSDRLTLVQRAAQTSGAIVLLKGARVAIAHPDGRVWVNPDSTPALARGGSGDILTGLIGGLLAQGIRHSITPEAIVQAATWWHAQAGIYAAQERTEMGVDAIALTHYLIPTLKQMGYC